MYEEIVLFSQITSSASRLFNLIGPSFHHLGDSSKAVSSVELYDFLEDTWTQAPSLKRARRNVSLVSLDGTLYAIAGIDGNGTDLSSVERFDYDNCQWEAVAPLSNCKGMYQS